MTEANPDEAGFTLVELLVALALLALIAIFIGEGVAAIRAMVPFAGRIAAATEIAAVRDHLRRTIGEAVAVVPANEADALVGAPDALRFFAPADPLLEAGGLNRIDLGLEPGSAGRLDLVERRAIARGAQTGAGVANVLLTDVAGLSFRFARAVVESGPPDWRENWHKDGLPALVSLEILLRPGDGRRIAPLLVHPAAAMPDEAAPRAPGPVP